MKRITGSAKPGHDIEHRDAENLELADAITHLLEECRMVLPGVQALFGFQFIAVFNRSFELRLTFGEQCLHLAALALVTIAAGLIMAPAALHRHLGPREGTERFLRVGGRLLLASLPLLILGIGIDFFIVAHMVLGEAEYAATASALLASFLAACWFVFPRIYRRRFHSR